MGFREQRGGGGNKRSCTVFISDEKGGGKNKLSISICVCVCHGGDDSKLVSSPLFPVGELEKQQGSKAPSLKNNGAQLELRARQGSPPGVC